MTEARNGLDYIGVRACGCVVAWTSSSNPPKDLAHDIASMIRSGLSVERCTTDESRQRLKRCRCNEQLALEQPATREEGSG